MPVHRQQYRYAGMPTMGWGCAASFRKMLVPLLCWYVSWSGGPRHICGPLFCAPKSAPNCPESAPKFWALLNQTGLSKHNEKPLEPLRFKGFRLVDDTGLEPVTSRTSSGCSYQLS